MKSINRMITLTILEIIFVICFVLISIPIWKNLNINKSYTVAQSYGITTIENDFEVSDFRDYILYQTSDNDALNNIDPILISYENKDTEVYLIIAKESTLDYRALKVNYDNNTFSITELTTFENDSNIVVLLPNLSSEVIHELILWIDSTSDYDTYDKELVFNISNSVEQVI